LNRLQTEQTDAQRGQSKNILEEWNRLPLDEATKAILPCCGSNAWAEKMVARRPLADEHALLAASDEIWRSSTPSDWTEAFRSHPRIGEARPSQPLPAQSPPAQSLPAQSLPAQSLPAQSSAWAAQEQRNVADADAAVKHSLAEANREYERRFNHIFIVCATGKSAVEILEILQQRLNNDTEAELLEGAEQQRQITAIRLKKWLQG
jgi:2-oxo-4-hydroxy-4-carboxy-5-ureidoimidazoline decarboxylase